MKKILIIFFRTWIGKFLLRFLTKLVVFGTSQQSVNRKNDKLRFPLVSIPSLEGGTVLNGPFKGMQYPKLKAYGSTLKPKLLGSYEQELHPIINRILNKSYKVVINIGCGEGYYAIGMALRKKNVEIHAYDVNLEALNACSEMAEINGVKGRFKFGQQFIAEDFKALKNEGALIICDCEGCEISLFTKESLPSLTGCDLLIETHDFVHLGVTNSLIDLFSKTHFCQKVLSTDDLEKAFHYNFNETKNLTFVERYSVFREGRPGLMYWLFLESKINKSD